MYHNFRFISKTISEVFRKFKVDVLRWVNIYYAARFNLLSESILTWFMRIISEKYFI